jgi:tRNA (adenine37-N6)-methyltransferase
MTSEPLETSLNLNVIGVLRSCYHDKFGTPRQSGLVPEATGFIELDSKFYPEAALGGLQSFSHLWILFWFHQNANKTFHPVVHPPRLLGQKMGVWATRSPHRPNPIGLSVVKIDRIAANEGGSARIYVSGIDLVDGTPVLDIKPYVAEVDSVPEAQSGWLNKVATSEIQVQWSIEPPKDLELKKRVENTLKLDPRPAVYRGFEGADEQKYRSTHAVRISGYDFQFKFESEHLVNVLGYKSLSLNA